MSMPMWPFRAQFLPHRHQLVSAPTSSPTIAAIPRIISSDPETKRNGPVAGAGEQKQKRIKAGTLIAIVAGDVTGIGVVALVFFFVYRLKRKRNVEGTQKQEANTAKDTRSLSSSSLKSRGFTRWACLRKKADDEDGSSDTTSDDDQDHKIHDDQRQWEHQQDKKGTLVMVDYDSILGQCCEMPVGYVQILVGIAGPLLLDGFEYSVPMATTEGCLVASTNRGCKAIYASGGATSMVLRDGMKRAPVVRFASAKRASELKFYLENSENFDTLAVVFNRSSRFARLQGIQSSIAGKNLYIRFTCSTGDAMGMNMVSKGVQNVLEFLQNDFPDMDVIGNSCLLLAFFHFRL